MHIPHLRFTTALLMVLAADADVGAADLSHPCAQVRDDTDRLACYDATFGKPERAAPTSTPVAPAPAPAQTVATIPAPVPAATPAEVPGPPARKAESPVVGAAVVTRVQRSADGRLVVTLDNSQIWVQLERDPAIEVVVGDRITVRRAALGSYTLVTTSGLRTKVRLR